MSLYTKLTDFDFAALAGFDSNLIYPAITERAFWESIPDDEAKRILKIANNSISFEYNMLRASQIMEFEQSGNRQSFERAYFENRSMLNTFVIAECIENKGRFILKIIDGIWLMCEETTWALPAHYFLSNESLKLADKYGEPILDLYALESAHMLSVIYCLLSSVLDMQTPLVCKRIEREIHERVIVPYLNRNDLFWMGFGEQNAVNNWNPWCNCNVLATTLLMVKDSSIVKRITDKALHSIDVFYDGYGADGGCEEGPGYWDRAGAALFEFLDILSKASSGGIHFGNDEKLANMGRYIKNVCISDSHFINFADARANTRVRGDIVYRFGKYVNDTALMAFGAHHELHEERVEDAPLGMSIGREVIRLGLLNEMRSYKATPSAERSVYMRDIGVLIARSSTEYNTGLVLAAKLGHNGECHNHNDVGSFVVYKDGAPIVIDVGVGLYTAKTFSAERYDIWYMNSMHHNTPIIDGIGQEDGKEHCAYGEAYSDDAERGSSLSGNIERAYPDNLLRVWRRSFFIINDEVHLRDEFDTDKQIELVFMTAYEPKRITDGIEIGRAVLRCLVPFDEIVIEKIDVLDPLLESCWGKSIFRTRFAFNKASRLNKTIFKIS